jgi:hypothetical protein
MNATNFYLSHGGVFGVAQRIRQLPFRRMPEPPSDDVLGTDSLSCVAKWCESAEVEFDRAQQAAMILADSFQATVTAAQRTDAAHCAEIGKIAGVL